MSNENLILERLSQIEQKIDEQALLKKEVLNFNDACKYLDISASHLYKLTSQKLVPHFCPQGKKLYFNRAELDSGYNVIAKALLMRLSKKLQTMSLTTKGNSYGLLQSFRREIGTD